MARLTEPEAFVRQAASDFESYKAVSELMLPACTRLHLLQMATEKLGKAVGLASSPGGFGRTPVAFSKTVRILRGAPRLADAIGMSEKDYAHFASRVLLIARMIEELHPQLPTAGVMDGPNVEYPWHAGESWIAPCDHTFAVDASLRTHDGARLLKLVGVLLRDFERWFN